MNPYFATQLMKRLSQVDKPAGASTASTVPKWAALLTWALAVAAVAIVFWLVTVFSGGAP